ncbi:hypothetical protein [Crocinitomix algicola]|uniref:hypothetical protein n=1 Tax=Crocinitomix algicola TaxID=1740263 RepID=UPI000872DB45|nr:hypothetical protein [Crocinitomix algicola]
MAHNEDCSLHTLIKTMSKSEKRQFRIYVQRYNSNTDAKFLALFDCLSKLKKYDEHYILANTSISKRQIANVKQHLYSQILKALSTVSQQKNIKIELREQLDFATILYNKGLYKQSLKLLDKAKNKALEHFENTIAFEIVEFEKLIESQFITRSLSTRSDDLAIKAKELSMSNVLNSKLSNLSLQLYSFFLKFGYAKSEEDLIKASSYYYKHLPSFEYKQLGFREELFLSMSQLWHSLIIQDFVGGYRNATRWVNLFDKYSNMKKHYPVFYLKGANYLLESLYFLRYKSMFTEKLNEFSLTIHNSNFPKNDNIKTLIFLYENYHQINLHFLTGKFENGIILIPDIEKNLVTLQYKVDEHHKMVFNYKFACLYFGKDDHENCITYLNKIINNKQLGMREDLLCFSRILRLISYYEAGRDELLEVYIKDTFRFLIKMNDLHLVQKEIISFLKKLNKIYPHELKNAFKHLHQKLKSIENHPFEKRPFLYLDILSWLEGKINNKSIQTIVLEKVKNMK